MIPARLLETSSTSNTSTSQLAHSQHASPAGLPSPALRQQAARPTLIAAHTARRDGPPCEVAIALCATCESLTAMEPGLARLNAYNNMVMQVGEVRDHEKSRVISMLLSQLCLLPEADRMDALRDVATLAGSAGPGDQPHLYAQIARAGALLPPEERAAAFRSMLLKTGSLGLDGRAALLAALATALSSLPDADSRKHLLTLLCSALDRLPPPLRADALEALVTADLKADALYLTAVTVALDSMQAEPALAGFPLLSQLAGRLGALPAPARLGAFEKLLGYCSSLPDEESADLQALLHDAIASLPNTEHHSARQAMAKGNVTPATGPHAGGGPDEPRLFDLAALHLALALACERSQVSQEATLCQIAADLDRLAPPDRHAGFTAIFKTASGIEPGARDRILGRLAGEICMLAEDDRLPAWTVLAGAADALPAAKRRHLPDGLADAIYCLPEPARAKAFATAHRTAGPGQVFLAPLACLPGAERIAAFRRAPTLDSMADLPLECRPEALELLGDARALPMLATAALVPAVRFLANKAYGDGVLLAALVRGLSACGERLPPAAIPPLLEAAAKMAKENYGYGQGPASFTVDMDTWLTVLDFAAPVLLRQSEATLKSLSAPEVKKGYASWEKNLGPARLLIETCQILRSTRTADEKSVALREMTPTPPLYYAVKPPNSQETPKEARTGHHMAALVVPLLHANMPEHWVCEHLVSKSATTKEGIWNSALATLATADRSDLANTLFTLVLRSNLSGSAKVKVLAGLSGDSSAVEISLFQRFEFEAVHQPKTAFAMSFISQVLESELAPEEKTLLLLGHAQPANDKSIYKSSALIRALTAVFVSESKPYAVPRALEFLSSYISGIASSTLPDDCKRQLLTGCHADGSNKGALKAAMATAQFDHSTMYVESIRMAPLPEAMKQALLRFD